MRRRPQPRIASQSAMERKRWIGKKLTTTESWTLRREILGKDYAIVCQERADNLKQEFVEMFQRGIDSLAVQQLSAFYGARVVQHFTDPEQFKQGSLHLRDVD
ncbi:hypothetical protein LSTR_LSTR011939 [Laodelphax striatellus]|uniref:Uncharacterized protein n=1 Tax=Laodelphax striatellus TaxID=195883 RepID=A0A482WY03_LAOST|nr:hypothetical protein LSTR_LSTR011939 [Laodelphax striatellus]